MCFVNQDATLPINSFKPLLLTNVWNRNHKPSLHWTHWQSVGNERAADGSRIWRSVAASTMGLTLYFLTLYPHESPKAQILWLRLKCDVISTSMELGVLWIFQVRYHRNQYFSENNIWRCLDSISHLSRLILPFVEPTGTSFITVSPDGKSLHEEWNAFCSTYFPV